MKTALAVAALLSSTLAAHAEYQEVNLTVFGMDCAPCAHAIHVSIKGIAGVNSVDVDLNTGLVSVKLGPGNLASMRQFNEAVQKNGFTHKNANIVARGKVTGTAASPFIEVAGTQDRFALIPATASIDVAALLGKMVTVAGTLAPAAKGKIPDTLRYTLISEAR